MTKQNTQGAEAEPSWNRNSDNIIGKILISELNWILQGVFKGMFKGFNNLFGKGSDFSNWLKIFKGR